MALKHNVVKLSDAQVFPQLVANRVSVLNFFASWHEPCTHTNTVLQELSRNYPYLCFVDVEAEDFSDLSEEFEIETVPTFIVVRGAAKTNELERVEGADASALTALVKKYATALDLEVPKMQETPEELTADQTNAKLTILINSYPVMLFIKGTPAAPKCGFSRQVIEIMKEVNCQYGSFDILGDEAVRTSLKEFSNWPTYPQIYVNGELIGGLDILKELVASGEFQSMIPQEEPLDSRLKKLVNRAPVMLFMKGDRTTPRCGFSRTTVKLLQDEGVAFETFDILGDEEVRAGLKVYSDWPTFPQVYVKGELVGGLDIVKELFENGEFPDSK